jgi:PAS domain-containing protein
MFRHFMKIAWFGLLVSYVAIWATLRREVALIDSYEWVAWLGVLGFVFWAYLAFRLTEFSRKFRKFSRQIISGNYETGIQPSRFIRDEVCSLEGLINKIADRLRFYDALRAEKVALSTRARELIHERSCAPIIIADVDTAIFRFNREARVLFGVDQEELSFDSIEKRPENFRFVEFFRNTVERDKVPHKMRISITLPIRAVSREALVEIIPIKDREEKVRIALIILAAESGSAAPQ